MSDRQLLRSLLVDGAIGVSLGGVFAAILLILNVQHLLDAIQSSSAPITTMVILVSGCCAYFGFGAVITGFQFVLMDSEAERS